MVISIETQFVESFIEKRKQERLIFELSHKDKAKRESAIFGIGRYIDYRYADQIKSAVAKPEDVYTILQRFAIPTTCYIMSVVNRIDGKVISINHALSEAVFAGPVIISCIHGTVAYFEDEPGHASSKRYILTRER